MTIITAGLLLVASLATKGAPILCIDGQCGAAANGRLTVAASEVPRSFVWIAAGHRRVIANVIGPGTTEVSLETDSMTARKFAVATSDGRARVDVAFELRCDDSTLWAWTIPGLPARPIELFHPEADCLLRAKAAGYRESERKLTKPDLGAIHLQRLPVLSGTITDATTAIPIRGAEILLPDGKRLGLSDASGRFAEPVESWPRALRVHATGYAARTVDVPKAIADAELRIALSSGGSVTLVLEPPLGKESVRWELRRIGSGGKSEPTRSGAMTAGQTEFMVDGLDPGTYHIVVMGDSPWQRFGMPVQVMDGTTSQALVRIEPAAVDLDVRFDGQPLEGATVDLRPEGGAWKAEARTDREGRIVEEIWQRGSFHLYVVSPPLVDIWRDEARADDDGTVRWTVSIPNRKVRGQVIDEETGQPISEASVVMELTDARRNGMAVPTSTAADGSFEFKALPIGAYRLEILKLGYETVRTPSFALTEFTTVDDRNVALRRASGRTVRVINAHGAPIDRAAVYVSTRSGTRFVGGLDANGRLTLPIADASSGTIFVLPSSGSIGIARLDSHQKSGGDEIIVTVPDGVASLEMLARSTADAPLKGVSFFLRYNGILLPPQVREGMTNDQGMPLLTDSDGRLVFSRLPQGRWELWPLASREDYLAVFSGSPPPAPVSVMLTPGHHTAKLVFRPKQ